MARRAADGAVIEVDTPSGLARAYLRLARSPEAALVLGHGANGSIAARDLTAASDTAVQEGVSVALVEQPYLVAGRRSPAPARQLDVAWTAALELLAAREFRGLPLIVGGRSAGARVACRTAEATGAIAVLCLAFPLHPPRRSASGETPTRLGELDQVKLPTLVVQGTGDPFGMPPPGPRRRVVQLAGNHTLATDLDGVREAVRGWLRELLTPTGAASASASR